MGPPQHRALMGLQVGSIMGLLARLILTVATRKHSNSNKLTGHCPSHPSSISLGTQSSIPLRYQLTAQLGSRRGKSNWSQWPASLLKTTGDARPARPSNQWPCLVLPARLLGRLQAAQPASLCLRALLSSVFSLFSLLLSPEPFPFSLHCPALPVTVPLLSPPQPTRLVSTCFNTNPTPHHHHAVSNHPISGRASVGSPSPSSLSRPAPRPSKTNHHKAKPRPTD